MKQCYVTIKNGHGELSGYSNELSRIVSFDDLIKLISQPNFFSLIIDVSNDPVIPDHQITVMKV